MRCTTHDKERKERHTGLYEILFFNAINTKKRPRIILDHLNNSPGMVIVPAGFVVGQDLVRHPHFLKLRVGTNMV